MLFLDIDHKDQVRGTTHFTDTAQRGLQFALITFHAKAFFFGQTINAAFHGFVDLLQALDRLGYGLPVCQRAPQPTVVHVILRTFLSSFSDRCCCLTFGADKQHAAAFGNGVADCLQGLIQHWNSLREIHDVNAIARAKDERSHPGVPALRLVAKVDACFKQLAHSELRKSHGVVYLSGFILSGGSKRLLQPADRQGCLP